MAKISIVNLNALYGAYRWDAECYQPDVLRDAKALANFPTVRLGVVSYITDGQHGYHEVDEESQIRHITARCVEGGIVTDTKADRLSARTHNANVRSQLEAGDVLLSTAGTIGEAGIVEDDILPANIDQDVARIALHDDATIDPYFLVAFLRSELGRFQSARATTGQIQGHITLTALREFDIPILKDQSKVVSLMRRGVSARGLAAQLFRDAENLLIDSMGLSRLDLSASLYYDRPFADLQSASRFGAEYFMPCKRRALDKLSRQPSRPLAEHFRSVRNLFDPRDAVRGQQIRNFDLTDALDPVLDDRMEPMPAIEIGSTKKRFQSGDIVISRLRAYLREIALVRTNPDVESVGSSEFIVLRPNTRKKSKLTPETLLIYLRSLPVQTILKWSQDGSQHPRFNEADLLAIPVPAALEDIGPEIDKLVNKALTGRKEATNLLEEAKMEVERMVLNIGK